MTEISRKQPCPCGSGKRYKNCCRKLEKSPLVGKVIGSVFDHKNKQVVTYTDDMLVNQVKRDSSKIAFSFDKLCDEHLKEISKLISIVSMLVSYSLKELSDENHQLELACLELLANALNSFTASTTLLRDGYRLQPGILIRNIIETMSTVLHLFIHQGDLSKFREGRLESPDTIAAARKVLPIFGRLYGFFSKEFAHLGTLHQSLQPLIPYTKFDDALSNNISFLRLTSLLMYTQRGSEWTFQKQIKMLLKMLSSNVPSVVKSKPPNRAEYI